MKAFIPSDKPRLWILSLCALMLATIFVAPMMFLFADAPRVYSLLHTAFITLIILGLIAFLAFLLRAAMGHYQNLAPKPWKDQVW